MEHLSDDQNGQLPPIDAELKELPETKGEKSSKMGRPPVNFDYGYLERILSKFPITREECAELMGVAASTLDTKIKDHYGMTFRELRDRKLVNIKTRLINKALDMSLNQSNTPMTIFCLKNIAGWTDKVENKITESEIKVIIDSDDANL